jgi:nucleoside-diphosphate-sugar epimerase
MRDLIYVEDVARANLLVANDERADGQVFNVGTGQSAEIGRLAEILAEKLGKAIAPQIPGEFRPGEMRALISDGSRIGKLGFQPQVRLEEGVERYLDWVREQGTIAEYFGAAQRQLLRRRVVKQTGAA